MFFKNIDFSQKSSFCRPFNWGPTNVQNLNIVDVGVPLLRAAGGFFFALPKKEAKNARTQ
ncbi:hypothetical protein CEQ90_07690 [Lewinellaceae bacterium SD302]|nr:hypothetical protein CEQ90_07690 [Lewinellaceae bacterium SD302]